MRSKKILAAKKNVSLEATPMQPFLTQNRLATAIKPNTMPNYLKICFSLWLLLLLNTFIACKSDTTNQTDDKKEREKPTLTTEQLQEAEQKKQKRLQELAKEDPRILSDSLVQADDPEMKAVGLKTRDGMVASFCQCHKERDTNKKIKCDKELREFFEKARKVATNPNATYEEFFQYMITDCK